MPPLRRLMSLLKEEPYGLLIQHRIDLLQLPLTRCNTLVLHAFSTVILVNMVAFSRARKTSSTITKPGLSGPSYKSAVSTKLVLKVL